MNSADCSGASGAGKYSITRGSAFMAVNVPRSSSRHARSTSRGVGAEKSFRKFCFELVDVDTVFRMPFGFRLRIAAGPRRRVFSGTGSAASDCSCLPGVYRSRPRTFVRLFFYFGTSVLPFFGLSGAVCSSTASGFSRPDRPLFCGRRNSPPFLRPYSATSFFERLRVLIVR